VTASALSGEEARQQSYLKQSAPTFSIQCLPFPVRSERTLSFPAKNNRYFLWDLGVRVFITHLEIYLGYRPFVFLKIFLPFSLSRFAFAFVM
jgi:hypothetical protein